MLCICFMLLYLLCIFKNLSYIIEIYFQVLLDFSWLVKFFSVFCLRTVALLGKMFLIYKRTTKETPNFVKLNLFIVHFVRRFKNMNISIFPIFWSSLDSRSIWHYSCLCQRKSNAGITATFIIISIVLLSGHQNGKIPFMLPRVGSLLFISYDSQRIIIHHKT